MQKSAFALLLLFMMVLSACSGDKEENKATKDKESTEETQDEQINVDKGLINVEVTLPASMFEGQDIDKVIADAKAEGVKEVTKNEDGSLTYKMSKAKHKEMMKDMETSINETIEDMKTGEDYVSIKDVTHNKDFTEFTLVVDKSAYENSMDGFAVFGLGISGAYYQMFNGVSEDDYQVTISVKDQATGEVFDKVVYPDDLEKENTEETE
ncbi:hypothetical protein [Bacillus timonensis]|uniref:hypothetical protein n=1 Tax=Bacillus timonensis TaxID=1033734 RepID=UPI000289ABC6|nr:hypothetical protein [Bacillus timonensis]